MIGAGAIDSFSTVGMTNSAELSTALLRRHRQRRFARLVITSEMVSAGVRVVPTGGK